MVYRFDKLFYIISFYFIFFSDTFLLPLLFSLIYILGLIFFRASKFGSLGMRRGEVKDRRELYVRVSNGDCEFCYIHFFSLEFKIFCIFCDMVLTYEFLLHNFLVSELLSILHCYRVLASVNRVLCMVLLP